MNPPVNIHTPHRSNALVLITLAVLVFISGFFLVFKAATPGNTAHWPGILWILSEFAAMILFVLGVWQLKKHRHAQPGYAPDADD